MKDRDWLFTCEGFYSDYSNERCCWKFENTFTFTTPELAVPVMLPLAARGWSSSVSCDGGAAVF